MNLKQPMIRSKKYTDAARGQSCVITGTNDGTIVSCHYSGMHSNRLGKGAGVKAHDIFVADLKATVHSDLDNYKSGRNYRSAVVFLDAIMATQRRRESQGLLFRASGKGLHEELESEHEYTMWGLMLQDLPDEEYREMFELMMGFFEQQIQQVYAGELIVKGMKA